MAAHRIYSGGPLFLSAIGERSGFREGLQIMKRRASRIAPAQLPGGFEEAELIGRRHIALDFHSPPEPLRRHVTTLFHFRCDERDIRDVQPASVGFLLFFLRGKGRMHFPGGTVDPSYPVTLITPTSAAAAFEVDGPFHCVGATLSPLGWAALTGLNADEHGNHLYDAAAWLGQEFAVLGDELRSEYAEGTADPAAMCARIAALIESCLRPVNPQHQALMDEIVCWFAGGFDPPLAELQARSGYSARQLQRLVERYYGLPPKQLVRKYRALRVAALLQDPATSEDKVAELLNLFYDQSHLIREIRHFAGRTPARLGDAEMPILDMLLDARIFREIRASIAPLPED